ncbi:MAG: DUF4238 domain-containing protein [Rhodospirillales bacterium]|nr:DUF4238 domain-containing protein [Rhodospirillales bacterium]
MVEHKKQHTVPNCYLKGWIDPETPPGHTPYVNLFDLRGGNARKKSPAKVLRMPDLYTIFRDGERDLRIEAVFSLWENNFVRVRSIFESGQFGTGDDAADLYAFVGAMLARPPHRIDFMKNQWASMAERMQEVRANLKPGIPPIRSLASDGPKLNLQQVQERAKNPMGTWFPETIATYIETLSTKFGCDVLVNETIDHSFLTSDAPAVIHHPPISDPRFCNIWRGLEAPGCEITLPLSPRLALLLRHKAPGIHAFLRADWETVFEVNHRTIMGANKTIISDKPDIFFVRAITKHIAKYDAEHPS